MDMSDVTVFMVSYERHLLVFHWKWWLNDIKAVLLSDIIKYDVKDVTSYGHQTYMV